MTRTTVRLAAAAAVLLIGSAAAQAGRAPSRWAQWRGPDGQGVAEVSTLPLEWSDTRNVRWRTAIPGLGNSSPIVWDRHVFLTTAVEGEVVAPGRKGVKHVVDGQDFSHPEGVGADRRQTFKVLALDADSGRILWERVAWEGLPYDTRHRRSTYAAPTPVTDGQLVYASFGSEGLYAYDFEGRLAWKKELGGIATAGVGYGTSPVLHGDLVIVQCDEDDGVKSFLLALDKRTGKEAWRVPRKVQVSWATPIVVRAAGRDELVTAGNEHVIAYDPRTGRELWRVKGLDSNAVPSPVALDDVVILTAGYPNKIAMAVRAGGQGDITGTPRVLWTYAKGTAYVPSPILYRGKLYLITDKGLITCLDPLTGAVVYEGARVPPQNFMASPVAFDGKLLVVGMDGDAHLVKAGPVHEVLRTNPMGQPVAASPAIAGDRLYIRGEKDLFCIEAVKPPA
jgi:outer membrane protein assembly factor BamB